MYLTGVMRRDNRSQFKTLFGLRKCLLYSTEFSTVNDMLIHRFAHRWHMAQLFDNKH